MRCRVQLLYVWIFLSLRNHINHADADLKSDSGNRLFSARVSDRRPLIISPAGLTELMYRTYVVSNSIILYYYTQLIGDARKPPTLLAAASFNDIAVIGL